MENYRPIPYDEVPFRVKTEKRSDTASRQDYLRDIVEKFLESDDAAWELLLDHLGEPYDVLTSRSALPTIRNLLTESELKYLKKKGWRANFNTRMLDVISRNGRLFIINRYVKEHENDQTAVS